MYATAFLSYAHSANSNADGRISALCRNLEKAVRLRIGNFDIFDDIGRIGWGEAWAQQISHNLHSSMFFIPVVTTAYFKSDRCREELLVFHDREKS